MCVRLETCVERATGPRGGGGGGGGVVCRLARIRLGTSAVPTRVPIKRNEPAATRPKAMQSRARAMAPL